MTTRSPELIRARLSRSGLRVHFMGVGGVGMAGLAFLLKKRGHDVSGCDRKASTITNWLERQGVSVAVGHAAGHLSGCDWLIRTSATSLQDPEIQAAHEAAIPVDRRGDVLPLLFEGTQSIAVAGTHGKTSTTTFATQLLRAVGRDPSWCIGGESELLGAVAGEGRSGILVVEADESDGTLAGYASDVAVITNVDVDHLDHFSSLAEIETCFSRFAANTRRCVVYCRDDAGAVRVAGSLACACSYAIDVDADLRAVDLVCDVAGSTFRLLVAGQDGGRVRLPIPGRHNVLNFLAALAACRALGVPIDEKLMEAAGTLQLPGRRFHRVLDSGKIRIISDYAHHPREIVALVATARLGSTGRLIAVFQPHRYSRTASLGAEFPGAFSGVDLVLLLPVYAASESAVPGGTHWDLYEHFRCAETTGGTAGRTVLAASLDQARAWLEAHVTDGDTLLLVGAGDVDSLVALAGQGAEAFAGDRIQRLRDRLADHLTAAGVHESVELTCREPIGPRTTVGVGGTADVWADVSSCAALAILLRFAAGQGVPWRIIGAGANVLVGDLGMRGITLRLVGGEFSRIDEEPASIRVGAGVALTRLLRWTQERNVAGYEFLDSIPATVGGAVRMNAGAHGHEICEKILSVTCMDTAGRIDVLSDPAALDFEYRRCRGLSNRVVLAATFRADPIGDADSIRLARSVIREKRAHWVGLRCAGSIFKNPPQIRAWELIDRIGFRGKGIGGARVNPKHANVIITEDGALASDVRALIEQARHRVRVECGVELEPEVTLFD